MRYGARECRRRTERKSEKWMKREGGRVGEEEREEE